MSTFCGTVLEGDVATDLDNPPAYLPSTGTAPAAYSDVVKPFIGWYYPWLSTLHLPGLTVAEAVAAARRAAGRMPRWTILAVDDGGEGDVKKGGGGGVGGGVGGGGVGRLEGYATSLVWGLRDDFTFRFVRTRAGVAVDGRSRSTDMTGDHKTNALRLGAFMGLLRREALHPGQAAGCCPSFFSWKGWYHMW